MKRTALYIGFFAVLVGILLPILTSADTITVPSVGCSASGYTVVYVNGIFDTEEQANADKDKLAADFKLQNNNILNNQSVNFQIGYNPSHLAGAGDLAQSLAQEFNGSISDYDLDTILMQVYPEVTTRKLLIVGHSQGADYANELYSYLLNNGEPKESVGVYAVATPAPSVAGGGKYLNSSGDSLLAALRFANFPILASNIDLPVGPNDTQALFPGHSFVDSYLAGAPDRIVSDISGQLSTLMPTDASDSGGCFTPPTPSVGYQAQQVAFAIADPTAVGVKAGVILTTNVSEATINTAYAFVAGATQFLADSITVTTEPHDANEVNQKNLQIIDKLYGGDLSDPEMQSLLGPNAGQGAAVALATQPTEQPVPVDGGYVEGTSTSASNTATATSSGSSIFPQTANGQVWVGGGSGPATTNNPPPTQDTVNDLEIPASVVQVSAPLPFDASTTPPTLVVPACAQSLSPDFCFVPTTSVTLTWDSVANALQYGININGSQTSTTATTTATVTLADHASSTVQVVAYDASSTPLASNSQTVYAFTNPVVINEVAWSGTYNSPTDQWVELKNRTPYSLDASKLVLLAEQGGAQYVPLVGMINGIDKYFTQGFPYMYLLERTQTVFTQVSGSTPQFAGAFDPLSPTGEQLALAWSGGDGNATTTLDETPAVSTCNGWCAGLTAQNSDYADYYDQTPVSMERINADVSGTLASNWANNDGYQQNAVDGLEQRIIGSPGAPNSNNRPLEGFFCDGDASILTPTSNTPPTYTPQSTRCTYLAGFIAKNDSAMGAIFEGTVGSSTMVQDSFFSTNGSMYTASSIDLSSYPAGQYFVAMWELNENIGAFLNNTFTPDTISYIETGAQLDGQPTPTPLNQIFIPFTYQP